MDTETFCCFSGHRSLPEEMLHVIRTRLWTAIVMAYQRGFRHFLCGGALGFDTLAAQEVLLLRELHPDVSLTLALPFRGQADNWNPAAQAEYRNILAAADEVIYTSETYSKFCMQKRNRFMVDHSALCICYLTSPTGGTAGTAAYALAQNREVVNLAQEELP